MTPVDPAWLLQQGGLVTVLLVVLYFYRRDYARVLAQRKVGIDQLVALLEKTTEALTEATVALERMSRAIEQLTSRERR